jgi:hypothetical protein
MFLTRSRWLNLCINTDCSLGLSSDIRDKALQTVLRSILHHVDLMMARGSGSKHVVICKTTTLK